MGTFDIAQELLDEPFTGEEPQKKLNFDVFEDILSGDSSVEEEPHEQPQPDVIPTGEVSAITGKPMTEVDPTAPDPPEFKTIAKAALVKDINTKIDIFSKARGISKDRYEVQDGNIVFRDKNGILREEKSQQKGAGVKQFAAETLADPSTIGATIGSIGGIPGTFIGAVGGETVRQFVASIILNDPQTPSENLLRLGGKALESVVFELIGKFGLSRVQSLLGRNQPGAKVLAETLGDDFFKINLKQAKNTQVAAKKFGIDLNLADTTNNKNIEGVYKVLRDLPVSANTIEAVDALKSRQLQESVPKFLKELGLDKPPVIVGKNTKKAAESVIFDLNKQRSKITSPMYEKAFSENLEVDVKPIIGYIDDKLKMARGDIRKALLALKNDFLKPDLPKKDIIKGRPASTILDQSGKPAIPAVDDIASEPQYETALEGLHGLKVLIDKKIKSPGIESVDRLIKRDLREIRTLLIDSMVGKSKSYEKAKLTHALLSSPDTKLGRDIIASEGLMSVIANAKEKDLINVSQLIMASKSTNKETVTQIKRLIKQQKNGDTIWDDTVNDFIKFKFENMKANTKPTQVGVMLENALFGNIKQKEIMKAALGDKFDSFQKFFNILKKTGISSGERSVGALKTEARRRMEDKFLNKFVTTLVTPLRTPKRFINDRVQQMRLGKGVEGLADFLSNPSAIEKMNKLIRLRPGSQELLKGTAVFMGFSGARELEDKTTGVFNKHLK